MAQKRYYCTAFTGGGTGALDAINTTSLADGSNAIVCDNTNGIKFTYRFDSGSSASESSPDVVAPDTGTGRWLLTDVFTDFVYGDIVAFTAADTTPSIAGGCVFSVPQAVSITDFDGEPSSGTKLIEVIASVDNVIIVHNASLIKLAGSLDVTMNTDDAMWFRWDTSKWVERGRILL